MDFLFHFFFARARYLPIKLSQNLLKTNIQRNTVKHSAQRATNSTELIFPIIEHIFFQRFTLTLARLCLQLSAVDLNAAVLVGALLMLLNWQL